MNAPMQSGAPQQIDVLRFPLHGSRLIEASAGTGKTYTIAALYVRLVLGHGGEQAFGRALTPPEILVVTFTEAATKELRDRIRVRLAQAAACFYGDAVDAHDQSDALLLDLRASYAENDWPDCARKLQLAAEWMDEAAVSTIHGWCNRMLREHAFDSDSLFTQTLETDQTELLAEVVRDYWRSFMYPLSPDAVAEVMAHWATPKALQAALRNLIGHAGELPEAEAPALALQAAASARQARLAELKAPWASWVDELQALLDAARAAKAFDGAKLKKNNYDAWLDALRAWCDDRASANPGLTEAAWARLSIDGLAGIWKTTTPPRHAALAALAELRAAVAQLPDARQDLLRHAARWVAQRFAAEQARRAQMGFDDLLTRLDAALQGPNGARLAEVIRNQFPVALIDEFQDTDAVQYRIFDRVYRVARNDATTALILIGDPKQAIYAFRGADIYTYLAARAAAQDRLYTLKRNFRSTDAMVAATNRCFELAEQRGAGAGAFLFRAATNPVPFHPADAAGRSDALRIRDADVAALTVWCLAGAGGAGGDDAGAAPLGKGAYVERMAAVCASEMVRLLNLGQSGQAGFVSPDGLVALRPADLAVLVNNRNEAARMRAALAARGVRSVYLSDQDSVFQCAQAGEVQFWLAACAEPDDGRALRAALATPTLGLRWAELDRLNQDEHAWERCVVQFRKLRDCWQRQGVLPMLRRLLNEFDIPARLLAAGSDAGGERILTDLLHLAELLQQASTLLDGEHALIRWLAEQRLDAIGGSGGSGDSRQVRLESDADLVQIVTVHKSKGLEYPLVFLPFACHVRVSKATDLPLKWHDATGRLHLTLDPGDDDQALARADRERLAEDLRKLYVAMTRARYATWIGVAPLDDLEQSAVGYLLGGGAALTPDNLALHLDELGAGHPEIALRHVPEDEQAGSSERYTTRAPLERTGAARMPLRSVREHWWIASYSALKTADSGALTTASADTSTEDTFREAAADMDAPDADQNPVAPLNVNATIAAGRLHRLPRGAEVGTFLHALLEWAAGQGFGVVAGDALLLRDAVARRCALRGWERWIDPLSAWLAHFLGMSLRIPASATAPPAAFALADIVSQSVEMEFWLAAHRVECGAIDALICRHTLGGAPRPALQAGQLNGMLKGFIDLVVEHEGRYYVLDYKSNWLGPDDAAYGNDAMRQKILDARYELQYVLYLLALHRLLRLRLPDYDYDRHIGGACYLFLRGAHAASQGLHFERPPRALIDALDALFAAAPEQLLAGEGA